MSHSFWTNWKTRRHKTSLHSRKTLTFVRGVSPRFLHYYRIFMSFGQLFVTESFVFIRTFFVHLGYSLIVESMLHLSESSNKFYGDNFSAVRAGPSRTFGSVNFFNMLRSLASLLTLANVPFTIDRHRSHRNGLLISRGDCVRVDVTGDVIGTFLVSKKWRR